MKSVSQGQRKPAKILFFAEAVTLAHVARPLVLARKLKNSGYEVHAACRPEHRDFWEKDRIVFHSLDSVAPDEFLGALAKGRPVYDVSTLRRYVEDDLALMRRLKPELVVGDFRLSLAVSAAVAGIPYVAICNAYWSPYLIRDRFPMPEHPLVPLLGAKVAGFLFNALRPAIFALHSLPLNRVRRAYGLPHLGYDLFTVYTHADLTLYADVPELFPMSNLPDNHAFLGPILWNDAFPKPEWWDDVPEDRPLVYLTLGSSGPARHLPALVEELASLRITLVVSTARKVRLEHVPANVFVADFLPAGEVTERANLVICNGGSLTTQQALAFGVPVLGICSNLDQFLNMEAIAITGAGQLMRAGGVSIAGIRSMAEDLLGNPAYNAAAHRVAGILARCDAAERFSKLIGPLLSAN